MRTSKLHLCAHVQRTRIHYSFLLIRQQACAVHSGHDSITDREHSMLSIVIAVEYSASRKQVAHLSQRNRAVGWVSYGKKWKIGFGRQYLRIL